MKVEELEAKMRTELEGVDWLAGTVGKSSREIAEVKRERIAAHRKNLAKLCADYLEVHGASTSDTHRSLPPIRMEEDVEERERRTLLGEEAPGPSAG